MRARQILSQFKHDSSGVSPDKFGAPCRNSGKFIRRPHEEEEIPRTRMSLHTRFHWCVHHWFNFTEPGEVKVACDERNATENPDHVRHPEGRVLHEAEAEEEGRRGDGHRGHAER